MLDSMRARLTLWYTGVLALALVIFAVATYAYLARTAWQRTDDSLSDTANSFVSNFAAELNDEGQSGDAAAAEATGGFRFKDRQAIIVDESRRVLAASDIPEYQAGKHPWPSVSSLLPHMAALLDSASAGGRAYATLHDGKRRVRAFATPVQSGGRKYTVVIAQSLQAQEETLEQVRRSFYIAVPLALLLASLGGYFLARKSLAPVAAMAEQATRIGAANLHQRLAVANERGELGRLASAFNDLLSRLDRSFEQQRRFMADASHELRTPVAIVRGEAEVALSRKEREPQDYRESLAIVEDEGRRLTRIVEDLFTLARADAGQFPLSLTDFYLDETVGDCVRSVRSLAAGRGLELFYQPPVEETPFRGDEALIRQMILNLLDNGIKHTPAGGVVRVSLERRNADYVITVADTGSGIPAEAQPHIFERFYRTDKTRSRTENSDGSGAGLGLSIALWVAEMHHGRILLDHSTPSGSAFVVTLPAPASLPFNIASP